jgi:hypothetical protein
MQSMLQSLHLAFSTVLAICGVRRLICHGEHMYGHRAMQLSQNTWLQVKISLLTCTEAQNSPLVKQLASACLQKDPWRLCIASQAPG